MKVTVPLDVSGTCLVNGERTDFQVKAGSHTAKTDHDTAVFTHLLDAGLASVAAPAKAEKE